jgi:hypothetical protein
LYQPPKHQREVDSLQAAIRGERDAGRRPLFRPPPPMLPRSGNPLDERLAEELEFLRRRISALGGALASDPMLVARNAAALQDIDLIAQTLGHLATIVAAADKSAAADRISLAELKARLKRKPLMSIVP